MIRLLTFILITAVLVFCTVWFADNPGNMTIVWLGYRFDGSIGMVALGLLALTVVLVLAWRGWTIIANSPGWVGRLLGSRRRKKGQQALTMGLLELASGDVRQALKHTRAVDRYLEDDTLTRLLTAQAAELDGNNDAAKRQFEAMLEKPDSAFFGLRGLLQLALKADDREAALDYAERAHRLRPRNPAVIVTLFDLLLTSRRWDRALTLLVDAQKASVFGEQELTRRRALLITAKAEDAIAAGENAEAIKLLRKALNASAGFTGAAVLLAGLYRDIKQDAKARDVILQSWQVAPSAALGAIYRDTLTGDPLAKVKSVEKLAATNPTHIESQLVLAEAALEADLWGVARSNLEKAMASKAEARHYRLLADLELRENQDGAKARDLLIKASHANPDPDWRCGACGAETDRWVVSCPSCHSFGSVDWRAPLRVHHTPAAKASQQTTDPKATVAIEQDGTVIDHSNDDDATAGQPSKGNQPAG
ncbi:MULTISPECIES: heme biosynthesis protein HemY [Thalassospira]|uniref:Heme biosynthesis protein HemY n=2 Tax=Thalassospira TaxID=168934 RepID=A0A367W147_9PROT|nr:MULTISPECIES: heme biosynthesis HemY N-terminal domain-containing protein [Thalassospira]MDG4721353.1 heme biosynthesis HemY N-terminal domain-containing protein [Thalassospira sp. FZY0004]RCK32911.1 heme biosynthesis protein HemY [Thalassospira profundimaris]